VQKRGYALFRNYGCVSCHQGSNIGGNMFQIFGVFGSGDDRAQVSPEDKPARSPHASLADLANDRNVYRVPSLRNVAVTPPYFHDGRTYSLREAVSVMARGQLGRTLDEQELTAITAFLDSLTGEYDGKPLAASPVEDRR
jgi:cytochrome c peroxidase